MIIFQFDQCFNDKKLARDCTAEELATAWCFPRRLMDEEDPVVLGDLLAKPNPLVTLDLRMARDHSTSIPQPHPGIVAISNGRGNPRTMTTSAARKVLVQFKKRFPDWHRTTFDNSIVEISAAGVEIWHVDKGRLVHDEYIPFDDGDWITRFKQRIRLNAERVPPLPEPGG
jgi:hypothetical protein